MFLLALSLGRWHAHLPGWEAKFRTITLNLIFPVLSVEGVTSNLPRKNTWAVIIILFFNSYFVIRSVHACTMYLLIYWASSTAMMTCQGLNPYTPSNLMAPSAACYWFAGNGYCMCAKALPRPLFFSPPEVDINNRAPICKRWLSLELECARLYTLDNILFFIFLAWTMICTLLRLAAFRQNIKFKLACQPSSGYSFG